MSDHSSLTPPPPPLLIDVNGRDYVCIGDTVNLAAPPSKINCYTHSHPFSLSPPFIHSHVSYYLTPPPPPLSINVNDRDYVGIGDTVNLAARFMAKANGKVFLDAATYNSLPSQTRVQ